MAVTGILSGEDLGEKIALALGLDASTICRVIVDCKVGSPVKIHVEYVGTKPLLKLDWNTLLEGHPVKQEKKPE